MIAQAHRGRPRDPRRDEAIYEAVLTLVAEVGVDRMSLDAVAQRAGVSKPTIYRRCPEGKGQLVAAAIAFRREIKPAVRDTGSLRGDLLAMVRRLSDDITENAHLAAGLTHRLRTDPALAAIFREHVIDAERDRWRLVLSRAAARGELRGGRAGTVSQLFADVGPSLIHSRMTVGEPLDDAFAEELVDHVLLPILDQRTL